MFLCCFYGFMRDVIFFNTSQEKERKKHDTRRNQNRPDNHMSRYAVYSYTVPIFTLSLDRVPLLCLYTLTTLSLFIIVAYLTL